MRPGLTRRAVLGLGLLAAAGCRGTTQQPQTPTSRPTGRVAALQQALAAEQAVVYGYGVVGAHLSGREQRYAERQLTATRRRCDRLAALVRRAGSTPVAARPAYRLPFPVTGKAMARRLAAHLEHGAADAAGDLAAATEPTDPAHVLATTWLTNAAVAAARWGAAPAATRQPD